MRKVSSRAGTEPVVATSQRGGEIAWTFASAGSGEVVTIVTLAQPAEAASGARCARIQWSEL